MLELKRSIEELKSEFNRNHQTLTKQIKALNDSTDELESMHKNTMKGSLVGSSIGAAGGVTALVGLALAPFTFGGSLALTAAGAVAGVAGGVTGGASNITDAIKQKSLRETIEKIINDFQSTINPMIELLSNIHNITEKKGFQKETLTQNEFLRAARGLGDILHIAHVADVAKFAKMCAEVAKEIRVSVKGVSALRATAQTLKPLRMTAALTGALSVVSLAFDVYSIVQDSTELSEMNQSAHKRNAEEIKSETLRFIHRVKEIAAQFKICVDIIKHTIRHF
ncbi:apolipoprotein L6-like [Rhinichthys klamathensis goyatoka]|uniref:apolipoprotein L6-like n=1 Tax=Rhinichthys klamathensis goyatoka TaxID=3034132 RepID=UPI0024B5751F|nr:apolipoprotein L6-like [Rhinichthys klamathensis goyatoka]